MKPLVAIIDWARQPAGDPAASIESDVLGGVAMVKTFLCDTEADFTGEILDARALIIWHNILVTAPTIDRLHQCRALIRNGVGFDSVDGAAAARRGIALCNVPDYGTEEVADHAIALTLALCRQLFPLDAEAKRLGWAIAVEPRLRRLRELTFGIIGLGRIGTATALRAKALGFKVVFYDPYLPNGVHKAIGVSRVTRLEDLLRASDVVSVHCPLNSETRHLLAEQELAWMRPTSFLVNTARGGIIKKTAILAALRNHQLAGAGLDVVELGSAEPVWRSNLRPASIVRRPRLNVSPT